MTDTAATDQKARFAIFRAADACALDNDHMPVVGGGPVDAEGSAAAHAAGMMEGAVVKVLFSDPVSGVSVTYAWLKANFQLPRHSHSSDCAYYVVSGEAHLGTEILKAGDGFFVPAEGMYVYHAGPQGVEVIEFRTAQPFDMKISGNSAAFWAHMVRVSTDNRETWRTQTPPEAASRLG